MDYYDILLAEKLSGGGGGDSSVLKYGSPLVMACGGANYFNGTMYLDYSSTAGNTRRSFWSTTGNGTVTNYPSTNASSHTTNRAIHTIPIKSGSTKVKLLCDYTCQVAITTYTLSGTTITSQVDNSGWINITADEILTYNISETAQELGLSFRRDENNTVWISATSSGVQKGGNDAIYKLEISFE